MVMPTTSKKIALFSHSAFLGGAETALENLVKLLMFLGHKPIVFLPQAKNPELTAVFKELGVTVERFDRNSIFGNTANALLGLSDANFEKLKVVVKSHDCDLVLSNSSSFIDGAMVAAQLGLPHIWSVHEMQEKNPEQQRGGLAEGAFARWFAAMSDHLLFCSLSTQDHHIASLSVKPDCTVIPPFLHVPHSEPKSHTVHVHDGRVNLMFIGAPTVRKNPVFAIEVVAALRARGRNVNLYFFGGRRDQTGLVEKLLIRRGLKKHVHFLGKVDDPYVYFSGKSINFICSKSEPFGLTVPEALSRGIPVVASSSDGPSETLDVSCQYELNNIDQCVRLIECVIDDYDNMSVLAKDNYAKLQSGFTIDHQAVLLQKAMDSAFANHKPKILPYELTPKALRHALWPEVLSQSSVIQSISTVTGKQVEWVVQSVADEKHMEGVSVGSDMKTFDVVPYQPSKQMDELYRSGVSFALELAANYNDDARLKMAAFIMVRLCTERTRLGRNLKVLAVGDGIGSDSIRLAGAGFDVDYMDYEASVTSRVAQENFKKFKNGAGSQAGELRVLNRDEIDTANYDAVISLEVIEHVEHPQEFLDFLNLQLKPEGLLFLSDCFSGIKLYWQTHLLSNERLSGLMPVMAAQSGFAFEGFNQEPLCKPYVFKKSKHTTSQLVTAALTDGEVMSMLVQEQTKLVKSKLRNVDKIVQIFKRMKMHWRGYWIRKMLTA